MQDEDREIIAELCGEETIIFDGMDDAIIGYGQQHGTQPVLVYSYEKLVDVTLAQMDPGTTREEAAEFVDFNTVGLYAGIGTPVIVFDLPE